MPTCRVRMRGCGRCWGGAGCHHNQRGGRGRGTKARRETKRGTRDPPTQPPTHQHVFDSRGAPDKERAAAVLRVDALLLAACTHWMHSAAQHSQGGRVTGAAHAQPSGVQAGVGCAGPKSSSQPEGRQAGRPTPAQMLSRVCHRSLNSGESFLHIATLCSGMVTCAAGAAGRAAGTHPWTAKPVAATGAGQWQAVWLWLAG